MPKRTKQTALLVLAGIASCSDTPSLGGEPESDLAIDPSLQPKLGDVVTQESPPPPISGGTLALARDEQLAVAADPDRDRVYVVDLAMLTVRHTVMLAPKAEPGRVALDGKGRAHVALRGSHELATIDLSTGALTLRAACVAPRGVAYDPRADAVYVACASGDVAVFSSAGADRRALLPRVGVDLRDVLVRDGALHVTEFRRARLLRVSAEGKPTASTDLTNTNVAWRAVKLDPDDDASPDVVVTQESSRGSVSTAPGGYGPIDNHERSFQCKDERGIVSARLWILDASCAEKQLASACSQSVSLPGAVLPVDVAANGREIAVVAAGNAFTEALSQVFVVPAKIEARGHQSCVDTVRGDVAGQAIALGFDSLDRLIVQTREPARLHVMTDDRQRSVRSIDLAKGSRADTGHAVFHANAGGNIACASCHAEGADDGHVWSFDEIGPRRTPSLLGTTLHTEPFHWDGDMKDLDAIVEHVFQKRMSGPKLTAEQSSALARYMFALPPPPKMRSLEQAPARGAELWAERCASCHASSMLTNNETVDVGTHGRFQVPSLVGVAWRGPWLHDGCAKTMFERFDPACGGGLHGDLSGLDQAKIADIVAFMETF
ncbi:MAG: cytochrome-c peroxidase [Labilithrix sp.]|nr:cytochrome-c peroxidase [Labilithrix sp.]MCW5810782.1 cytochrome-c peroxidase [Labilithrix sp.]